MATSFQSQIELLHRLRTAGIDFVIIGGHAVNFHGHIRSTEDVDILWLRTAEGERSLVAALRAVNATWIHDQVDPATGTERLVPVNEQYVASRHLMMLVTPYGFLDIFDYVPGIPDADVHEVFAQSQLAGAFRYASGEWLKRMKQASGRPQDLLDLKALDEMS
jgi:hypothetical protein